MKMEKETVKERQRRLARERKRRQRERQRSSEAVLAAKAADALRRMGEESFQERQRRLARERQRRRRERQSSSEAEAARAADALRRRVRLSQENEYEREIRRRKERERIALRRRNSSREETEERRRIERERIAWRRNNETDEDAVHRRHKTAENMRRLRAAGISTMTRMDQGAYDDEDGDAATTALVSTLDPFSLLSQHAFLYRPTDDAKFLGNTQSQFEDQCFENEAQKATIHHSVQTLHSPAHAAPRQVLTHPVQVVVPKTKPVEKPRRKEKRLLAVANHQRGVMSSLVSLWKSGKLCDAGIGNGSSTVKVHKLVLSAVCPKLLSVSNMDKISHKFLQVNFPETVSKEALNAFAEFMYNGILDLDLEILEQLKIIARRLDMEEFEKLCDSHLPDLPDGKHQSAVSGASSFTNVPLIQTTMPIPAMTSSLASFGSTISSSMHSAQFFNTPVIDIKREISEDELAQVNKDTAAMFGHDSEVASLAPNKSGDAANFVISPSIKIEPVGPEDNKYGHWSGSKSNRTFTSTTPSSSLSSSIAAAVTSSSVPVQASSTEFAIPFSEATDARSTRLKAPHSYEAPLLSDLSLGIVETASSQSSSINENSSKPLSQPLDSLPSVKLPNNNDAVYPVTLFRAKGDNLPLLTTHSTDAMTVNSFIPSEKT